LENVVAEPNRPVRAGDTLMVFSDPELRVREKVLAARLVQEKVRYNAALGVDRAQANAAREVLAQVQAQLDDVRRRIRDLTVRSAVDGVFIVPGADDLPGRYFRRGALLGYVLTDGAPVARVVVRQDDLDLVRERTGRVSLRLAERVGDVIDGRIVREVPAATDTLPSRALSLEGGGHIALDPRDPKRSKAIETLFEFDVALPGEQRAAHLGQRVYVRFDHGRAPLAWQVYRLVRVLFLSKFHV
jgi:putative peptide zinc metalloprotease protein